VRHFNALSVQRFTTSFVNLHHEFAVWIDISPVHSRGVKRQRDVALAVDRNQSTAAAELGYLIKNTLRSLLEWHSAILHQSGNIVRNRGTHKIFAVTRGGDGTGRVVRVSARADNRRIAYASRALVSRAAS